MDLSDRSYRRAAQACGALVAVAGWGALAGWATGQSVVLGVRASYIPMAPNTALAFIVPGSLSWEPLPWHATPIHRVISCSACSPFRPA